MSDNSKPAFPHQDSGCTGTRPGMTLREYAAVAAMQGILASCNSNDEPKPENLAFASVRYADALLAELGEK